jgi:hypothetical protein
MELPNGTYAMGDPSDETASVSLDFLKAKYEEGGFRIQPNRNRTSEPANLGAAFLARRFRKRVFSFLESLLGKGDFFTEGTLFNTPPFAPVTLLAVCLVRDMALVRSLTSLLFKLIRPV